MTFERQSLAPPQLEQVQHAPPETRGAGSAGAVQSCGFLTVTVVGGLVPACTYCGSASIISASHQVGVSMRFRRVQFSSTLPRSTSLAESADDAHHGLVLSAPNVDTERLRRSLQNKDELERMCGTLMRHHPISWTSTPTSEQVNDCMDQADREGRTVVRRRQTHSTHEVHKSESRETRKSVKGAVRSEEIVRKYHCYLATSQFSVQQTFHD